MKLLPIMIIFIVVAMFVTIMPNIFGSFETEHNMTESEHEDEYTALTELTQIDMTVLMGIGTMLVLGLVFILGKVLL